MKKKARQLEWGELPGCKAKPQNRPVADLVLAGHLSNQSQHGGCSHVWKHTLVLVRAVKAAICCDDRLRPKSDAVKPRLRLPAVGLRWPLASPF
jgi:hypothetical protein